jgi:hypothetical protein
MMRNTANHRLAIFAAGVIAVGIFVFGPRAGAARLVAVHDLQAGMCTMPPDPSEARAEWIEKWQQYDVLRRQLEQQPTMLLASLAQGVPRRQTTPERRRVEQLPAVREIARKPEPRILGDTYPTFTAIGVYTPLNQIVIQDNNLWSTWIFNRTDNSAAPTAPPTKPKTIIQGDDTHIQFNNGIWEVIKLRPFARGEQKAALTIPPWSGTVPFFPNLEVSARCLRPRAGSRAHPRRARASGGGARGTGPDSGGSRPRAGRPRRR